jgi:hypothetical protein
MVIIITIVCFVSFIWGEAGVVKFGHLSNDRAHISLALGCHITHFSEMLIFSFKVIRKSIENQWNTRTTVGKDLRNS